MLSKEVRQNFTQPEFAMQKMGATLIATRYQLAERLQLTHPIDQAVMVGALMLSLGKNKVAHFNRIANMTFASRSVDRVKHIIEEFPTEFETALNRFVSRHYEPDSQRPMTIRKAINNLVAYSVHGKKTGGITIRPDEKLLKAWEEEFRTTLSTDEGTGIKFESRYTYRRKPRTWKTS